MDFKILEKVCYESKGNKEVIQNFMKQKNISCDEMQTYCDEMKEQACCDKNMDCEDMIKSYVPQNSSCCDDAPSDCCASDTSSCGCGETNVSNKACGTCESHSIKISAVTLKAQLKKEFYENIKHDADDFHFCTNPNCDTVYYSSDGTEKYGEVDIKSKVACKNEDLKTPLCHCKKLLKGDVLTMIENGEENIPSKVKSIISEGKTFCEKANPRGTCCTQDIATFLAKHGLGWNDASNQTTASSCGC